MLSSSSLMNQPPVYIIRRNSKSIILFFNLVSNYFSLIIFLCYNTVRMVDQIAFPENEKIIECGKYEEFIEVRVIIFADLRCKHHGITDFRSL